MFVALWNARYDLRENPDLVKIMKRGEDQLPDYEGFRVPDYAKHEIFPKNLLLWQAYVLPKSDVSFTLSEFTFKKLPTFPLFRGPQYPYAYLMFNLGEAPLFWGREF